MKKFLPGLLLGLALGAAAAAFLFRPGPTTAPAEKPAATEPAPTGVQLTAAQVATAGLVSAAPTLAPVAPELTAYARVLDPTPLIAAAADLATAQASLTASEKELTRVRTLHEAGENASTQAVETAEAAAQRDRIQLAAARARLVATWGPALTAKLDAGLSAESLAATITLVRLDLPAGDVPLAEPTTVNLTYAGEDAPVLTAEILGAAPSADPQFQGRGYLALLAGKTLPAGAALHARLPAGTAAPTLVLPRSAFVRHEGSVFVYVRTATTRFERRRVELGAPQSAGLAIRSGLGPQDDVVITGAQQLLSSELGGAAGGD